MTASAVNASAVPTRLGKYELLLPLAAGGMARIYIARSTGIGAFERHVVLKVITPERAQEQVAVKMFLDEARLAASLNHQNVAQVFEVGEDGGIHYLAMEYVHGQDLRALLAKAGSAGTRIPIELGLTVVAGAAAGLHHAHERRGPDGQPLNIVHRDVSPSNIMVGYDGAVKLLDFGIAKATSRSVETQSGIIKGKFAYMAPEQCRGREVDRRSDVFSLGIILYEISTQHRCFRADSDFDTMHRIVTGDVVRPSRLVQSYPPALEAIVMKALATDPSQRYQSSGLLLEALESFAVSGRMSLSTMSLGRFMRDMFGEVAEPWLTAGRGSQPVVAAKEATISSTDAKTPQPNLPARPAEAAAQAIPEEDARFLDSARNEIAAKTVLDLPRERRERAESEDVPEWNARSYPPSAQPAVGSPGTGPAPSLPRGVPTTPARGVAQQPVVQQALGAQPHTGNPFATPGSSSGSRPAIAVPGQPIPATRHGYAGAPGMTQEPSYPRYSPPMEAAEPRPRSNRRPLIIGLALAAIGIVVMLIVKLGGGGGADEDRSPAPVEPPAPALAPPAAPVVMPSEPADDMITVHVVSHPAGADVLVAGTKIGTTPLDSKLRRGSKIAELAIHLVGYEDVTTKIDLGGDFSREVTLKEIGAVAPEPATQNPKAEPEAATPETPKPPEVEPAHKKATATKTVHPAEHKVTSPPAPKCQPRDAYNPYDTSCGGQPCPMCK